jgi:hypothetical protein
MGKIYGNGINQEDLVDLLAKFKTNLDGLLAKLDADAAITDTDYLSTMALTMPAGINTSAPKGIADQGAVLTFLQTFLTKWAALLTKIDTDLGDTTYATTHAVPDTIQNPGTGTLEPAGVYQGALVHLLDDFITKFNALLASLDGDDGVTGTNYAALWAITDTVDASGTAA